MAEPTQFNVTYKELIELLIKHSGVHEGRWSLSLGIQFGVGLHGPSPDQMALGATFAINTFGIQRVPEGQPPSPGAIVVDAKEVNPPPKHVPKRAR